jgi:hypothetical protein
MVLELIQKFFGVGDIAKNDEDSVYYRVTSLKDITEVLIPHFDKYSLITQKLADYLLFKEAVLIMSRKEHLTVGGFQAIVNIRASINRGLSEEFKVAFPKAIPVKRPVVVNKVILDPQWLAGFTTAVRRVGLFIYKDCC